MAEQSENNDAIFQEVAKLVAAVSGTTTEWEMQHHAGFVREVKHIAEKRARQKGTTVSEQLPRAVKFMIGYQQAKEAEIARTKTPAARYTAVERHITNSISHLKKAVQDSSEKFEGEFSDEQKEFLGSDLNRLRSLLDLMDLRISGHLKINWDDEMKKLGEQS